MENFDYQLVANASDSERVNFYKKTYLHVAMAILAFILVETILLIFTPPAVIEFMLGGRLTWLAIIGIFWLASMLANGFVMSESRNVQYAGLGLYVLIEALIFLPMMYIVVGLANSADVLLQAGLFTLFLFAGLTYLGFTSSTDFSFMKSILVLGGFISIGLIVCGALFGFELGLWFSLAMVLLAGGSILYNTQNMKEVYHTEQYVGAALQLFASIMLMYWYILRILLRSRR